MSVFAVISVSCGSSPEENFPTSTAQAALVDYKKLVYANYKDVLETAEALDEKLQAFVAEPSAERLGAARRAWIAARVPYGPSEAFRFYDGPIDNPETGREGAINAWPLDENYIDYTRDEPEAGLISDTTSFPKITLEAIDGANEAQGEKAISTGYHAIEFLLWGQDDLEPGHGAGKRPYTDYLSEEDGGTEPNADRRGTYLKLVSQLLVDDLSTLVDAWKPEAAKSFAKSFGVARGPDDDPERSPEEIAIGKLLRAIGSMAKAELSGERMTVAFKNRSQEDEHSCFSDNTATDLLGNGLGIENVWLGRYQSFDGVGLDEVTRMVDEDLAAQTTNDIAAAVAKLKELDRLQREGTPIDVILQAADSSAPRRTMLEAIEALKRVGDDVEKVSTALGLSVQLEEASEEL